MKNLFTILTIFTALIINAQSVFINEIHYDNAGGDVDEGIEIAAPAGTDLSCYDLVLYNGSSNESYATENLTGIVTDQSGYGFGTIWFPFPANGMQNGDNDGIALYDNCNATLIQFLSYEGALIATNGVADGVASTDIGVAEVSAPVGSSLQLIGSGTQYSDFIWSGPSNSTYGNVNDYQSFGGTATTTVFLNPATLSVNEADGTINFDVSAVNLTTAVTVDVSVLSTSTATENADFTLTNNQVSFTDLTNPSQNMSVEIVLNDDYDYETEETIELEITSADATISNGNLTITVFDNDAPTATYTPYAIADVTGIDADGLPTFDETEGIELNGIIHGVNLFTNGGISTTLIDANGDGINVFTLTDLGINPQEGDDITARGFITSFNGLLEIEVDEVILNSAGNTVTTPETVLSLGEETESQHITIQATPIANISESDWLGDGSSFNVRFLNSNNDTLFARVDDATELASMSFTNLFTQIAPYDITGIGGQFDNSIPQTEGYQIFPMYESQIVLATVSIENFEKYDIKTIQTENEITFVSDKNIESVSILNLEGKTLKTNKGNSLNVNSLQSNIYFAVIKIEGKTATKKIFVR